jgi:hypothetical protein
VRLVGADRVLVRRPDAKMTKTFKIVEVLINQNISILSYKINATNAQMYCR